MVGEGNGQIKGAVARYIRKVQGQRNSLVWRKRQITTILCHNSAESICDGVGDGEVLGNGVGFSQRKGQVIGLVVEKDQTILTLRADKSTIDVLSAIMLEVGAASGAEIATVIVHVVEDFALAIGFQTVEVQRKGEIILRGNGYPALDLPEKLAVVAHNTIGDPKGFREAVLLFKVQIPLRSGVIRG